MSDQTQTSNQQVIVYALVAIAVLLAAIVGFMIYNNVKGASTAGTSASTTTGSDTSAAAGIAASMPTASGDVAFDPKTATKLPAGVTPEQAIAQYSKAVMAGDWPTAYSLLPLSVKKTYGDPTSMGSQLKQYGITGFTATKPVASGADTTIVLTENTPMMNISYQWSFTKAGSTWYVKGRASAGTGGGASSTGQ